MGIAEKTFKPEAVDTLMRYHWPGNVRELENLMERLLVLSEGPTIGTEELPDQVRRSEQDPGTIREQVLQGRKSLGDAVDEFEREIIVEALGQTDFNQTAPPSCSERTAHPQVPHGQAGHCSARALTRVCARMCHARHAGVQA